LDRLLVATAHTLIAHAPPTPSVATPPPPPPAAATAPEHARDAGLGDGSGPVTDPYVPPAPAAGPVELAAMVGPEPARAAAPRSAAVEMPVELDERPEDPWADASSELARPRSQPRERRGTSPAWLVVPLLLVSALLGAVYWPARPAAPLPTVRVQPVQFEAVVRLFQGAAQLHAVDPLLFSFAEAGTVAELLPPGQQVKAGDTLAKLDGYVKLEQQLAELRGREVYYQNELEKAERADNQAGMAHARAKVEEKRTLIATLQARYAKYV